MSSRCIPISQLSSYLPRWEIQARVLQKTALSSFPNRRGGPDNQVFSIDVLDREGDVIRGKFWNAEAVRWNAVIEKGKTYNFKNGKVVIANKRFSALPHNYEITFDISTEISESSEAVSGDARRFHFVDLRGVKSSARELPFMVDLLAVIKTARQIDEVATKRNELISRRNLVVVDSTQHQMELTVWGELAKDPQWTEGTVIAAQSVQIREFRGGRLGQTSRDSHIVFSPTTEEGSTLKEWYTQNGSKVVFEFLRSWEPEANVTKEMDLWKAQDAADNLTTADAGLTFKANIFPTRIWYTSREGVPQPTYTACGKCNKKVSDSGAGFRCEFCDSAVEPMHRYLFGAWFADSRRGKFNGKMFHEQAETLLSTESSKVASWVGANEKESVKYLFEHQALWARFVARIRMKMDNYRGDTRMQNSVLSLEAINFEEDAANMLRAIRINCPDATKKTFSRKHRMTTDENVEGNLTKKECRAVA